MYFGWIYSKTIHFQNEDAEDEVNDKENKSESSSSASSSDDSSGSDSDWGRAESGWACRLPEMLWSEPWTQGSEPAPHYSCSTTRGCSPHCNTSTATHFTQSLFLCFNLFSLFSWTSGFYLFLPLWVCLSRRFWQIKCAWGCVLEIPPQQIRERCRAWFLLARSHCMRHY